MKRLYPLLPLVAAVLLSESVARLFATRQFTGLLLLIGVNGSALIEGGPVLLAAAALASVYLAMSLTGIHGDLTQLTWAGIAIPVNAGTLWALTRRTSGLEDSSVSGRLLSMQDDEKKANARQLHDTTSQNLAALSMMLAALKSATGADQELQSLIAECGSLTSKSVQEIRALSYALHPPLLDELGLEMALKTYLESFRGPQGEKVELHMPAMAPLPQQTQLIVFRMIQQRLEFLHRETGAHGLRISFSEDTSQTVVQLSDSLPAAGEADLDSEAGRSIMLLKARARQLCSPLEIQASPRGTTIRARITK